MHPVFKTSAKWVAIGVLGIALGAGLAYFTRPDVPEPGSEGAQVGDPRPSLEHAQLDGEMASIDAFDGQAVLVNFWATWCAPCRREMPLLQSAYEDHSGELVVLGVAMDDTDSVASFVDSLGISYPIWVGQTDVSAAQRRWGNPAGALPYTVLVDAEGIIRWQHLGEVSPAQLEGALAKVF